MVICYIISNKQYNMYIVLVVKRIKLNYVKILLIRVLFSTNLVFHNFAGHKIK